MLKKYITTLKNGEKTKIAEILGRKITLIDGEILNESVVTKTFPSLFEEIVEVKHIQENTPEVASVKVPEKEPEVESSKEELLIDESSNVTAEVVETPKKRGRSKKA